MWRDTSLRLQFLIFDAWVLVFILVWVFHWRWWTFKLMIAGIIVFGALGKFGLTPVALGRWIRGLLSGPVRPAVVRDRRRRLA